LVSAARRNELWFGIGSRETRELIRKASDAVLNHTHHVAADLQPA